MLKDSASVPRSQLKSHLVRLKMLVKLEHFIHKSFGERTIAGRLNRRIPMEIPLINCALLLYLKGKKVTANIKEIPERCQVYSNLMINDSESEFHLHNFIFYTQRLQTSLRYGNVIKRNKTWIGRISIIKEKLLHFKD